MRLFLLTCLLGLAVAADAQNSVYSLRHFGTEDGLPDRWVRSIAQDRQGYIWLATPKGLARFDGQRFKVMGRRQGLDGDYTAQVLAGPDGMLWVTYGRRFGSASPSAIDLVDPVHWTVASFAGHFGASAPCRAMEVASLRRDSRGAIVLSTVQGKAIVYAGDGHFRHVHAPQGVRSLNWVPMEAGLAGIAPGAAANGGCTLRVIAPEGGLLHEYNLADRVEPMPMADPVRDGIHYITSKGWPLREAYYLAPDGHLQHSGPLRLRDQWVTGLRIPIAPGEMLVDVAVRRCPQDSCGADAALVFDLAKEFPGIDATVRCAMHDRQGRLWLGTTFGFYQLTRKPSAFKRLLHQQKPMHGYGFQIRGMQVRDTFLYVNTEGSGYYVLQARTGTLLAGDTARLRRCALTMDADGTCWSGEYGAVVHRRAGDLHPLKSYPLPTALGTVWSMARIDARRWLVGAENGLRVLDTGTGRIGIYDTSAAPGMLDSAMIEFVGHDRQGALWACSENGLYHLGQRRILQRWCTTCAGHELPTDHVLSFMETSDGTFWLGTKNAGLVKLDPARGTVRSYGPAEGFPDNTVYAVLEDRHGHLWASTDHGLVYFDPVTERATTFRPGDGIAQDEFNRTAYALGPDGRMYFGGLNGITAFDPDGITAVRHARKARLVISTFLQYDAATDSIVDRSVEVARTRHVTVRPGDRFFRLGMALLSYTDPASITYRWRLNGAGGVWNEQKDPDLIIRQLPYGAQELRLEASVDNGQWQAEDLVLNVSVQRPFYLSWWFIALVLLAVMAGVTALFRYRLAQARRVFAVRDRIAADLHDEIGSTLSSVALYSAVARQRSDDPDSTGLLDRITEGTTAALESMNDIVWSVNSRFDGVEHLFDRMRAFAVRTAEEHGFQLHFSIEGAVEEIKLDMEQRKNLYLFFREAVHNVAKHAACSALKVELTAERHRLKVHIVDDGKGMPTTKPAAVNAMGGNGLANMRKRSEALHGTLESTSEGGKGTAVRLEVPL